MMETMGAKVVVSQEDHDWEGDDRKPSPMILLHFPLPWLCGSWAGAGTRSNHTISKSGRKSKQLGVREMRDWSNGFTLLTAENLQKVQQDFLFSKCCQDPDDGSYER
jgi:hypothetical protein